MTKSNTRIDSVYSSPFIETMKRTVVRNFGTFVGEFMISCSFYRLKKINGHMYSSHIWPMGSSLKPLEHENNSIIFFMTWYYMSPDYIIGSILTPPLAPRPFTCSWLAANRCKLRRSNHNLVIRLSSFSFCY